MAIVGGRDAEETISDVDEQLPGLDRDQCCNTFAPAGIFKMHMLDTLVSYT